MRLFARVDPLDLPLVKVGRLRRVPGIVWVGVFGSGVTLGDLFSRFLLLFLVCG